MASGEAANGQTSILRLSVVRGTVNYDKSWQMMVHDKVLDFINTSDLI